MDKNKQKRYNLSIDILRSLAIFAVVMIHTTTITLQASHSDLIRLPWTLFLNQISRFAVPMFFMISGFVLELNYSFHKNYFSYLYKRINKLFIPYVFWTTIYYFFIYNNHPTNTYIQKLINGDASYQLYFIPTLLIFYLLFPMIRLIRQKWLLIILGVLQIAILYYDYHIKPIQILDYKPLAIALLGYFAFLIGVMVARNQDKVLIVLRKWILVLLIGTFGLGYLVYYQGRILYFQTNNYLSYYSQWRPSVLIYTFALTGSLFYLLNKRQILVNFTKTMSRLSFFVFFVHVIVLEFVWQKFGTNYYHASNGRIAENLWYDPLFFLLVAGFSFGLAYLSHKIPYLSKLTG